MCFNKNITEELFLKKLSKYILQIFFGEIFSKLEGINQTSVATWKGIEQQTVEKT